MALVGELMFPSALLGSSELSFSRELRDSWFPKELFLGDIVELFSATAMRSYNTMVGYLVAVEELRSSLMPFGELNLLPCF